MSASAAARRPYQGVGREAAERPEETRQTSTARQRSRPTLLWLAKVAAAARVFDEPARRDMAQIVNLVRRIRAHVKSRPFGRPCERKAATRSRTVTDCMRFID